MDNLPPAIPIADIVARLEGDDFSDCDVPSLSDHSKLREETVRNRHLCFVDRCCGSVLSCPVSTSQLTGIFQLNETTVCQSFKKGRRDPASLVWHIFK
jgi:hypothetical protein